MSHTPITDDSWGARRAFSGATTLKADDGSRHIEGVIGTPSGWVRVYSYPNYSMADFIWRGRQYRRTWQRGFTERGLTTVAVRFMREVAGPRS